METHLIVSASGPWYTLFYTVAFLSGLGVLLYEGYTRKYPLLKWLLLLAITQLFIIAGSKLITYSSADWNYLFTHLALPPTDKKSLAGGLAAGITMLFAGRYLLKFRPNPADAFALVLPLTLAIQRIGCFISGCCYGRPTELPWGISYPVNTLAHYHHFQDGLISSGGFLSLPVHPVQLYELILLVMLIPVILWFRNKLHRPGSLMLLSLSGVLAIRFSTEFFRAPEAHTFGGAITGILNTTQYVAFFFALLILLFLWKREQQQLQKPYPAGSDISLSRAILFLITFSLLLWILQNWLTVPERIAIAPGMALALSVILYRLAKNFLSLPNKWFYPAALLVPLFLMAQTYPRTEGPETVKKYHALRLGFAGGNASNRHNIGTGEGCDRIGETEYFDHSYSIAGAAYEVTYAYDNPFEQLNLGIKGYLGSHREIRLSDQRQSDYNWCGVTPYGSFETNWLGLGAGLHLGNLGIILENKREEGTGKPLTGILKTNIYPQLYFRFGPRSILYLDYRLADHFPSALPGYRHQLGIGSGLGLDNGTTLRFGGSSANIFYVTGTLPIRNRYVIEPLVLIGEPSILESDNYFYQFSLGISYRFGHTEKQGTRMLNH
jgi:prolipoprotein diacylglyceryltransferase